MIEAIRDFCVADDRVSFKASRDVIDHIEAQSRICPDGREWGEREFERARRTVCQQCRIDLDCIEAAGRQRVRAACAVGEGCEAKGARRSVPSCARSEEAKSTTIERTARRRVIYFYLFWSLTVRALELSAENSWRDSRARDR